MLNALAVALQPLGPVGNEVAAWERRPLVKGWKLGATAKPPPETWVPLPQAAAAVAEALEASGALAKRVTAGFPFFLPFLAPASAAAPIADSVTASIATRALRLRILLPSWRPRSLRAHRIRGARRG